MECYIHKKKKITDHKKKNHNNKIGKIEWNENLFDETVNGATVGGEIGGISVGIYKKPKQIVGEFGGHVVDVNPKGKSNRVIWMGIESIRFGIENGVVEVVDV